MPNIERNKVRAMLEEVQEADREPLLIRLKERGFNIIDDAVPQDVTPMERIAGSKGIYSKAPESVIAGLEDPLPIVGGGLETVKTGLESASSEAGKYYSDLGVPAIGQAAEMGGKFIAASIPSRMKDALFIAAAGPALKLAGIVGKPIAKAGGNFLADIAGSIAGKSPEAVKAIYRSPGALWKKANEVFTLKHQEALVNQIDEGHKTAGMAFKELEDAVTGFVEQPSFPSARVKPSAKPIMIDLGPVLEDTTKEMLWSGHKLPKSLTGKKPIEIGRISEKLPEYKAMVEKLNMMKDAKKLKFGEALNLRRQFDDMIDYGIEGSSGLQPISGEANRVLSGMRKRLNEQMKKSVPHDLKSAWDKANSEYSAASSAYAELKKQVVGTTPRNTERKLLQMIGEGRYDDEVLSRAIKLGEKSAKAFDDIRDHLAAREFQRWSTFGKGGLSALIPTSPRVVGIATSGAGIIGKGTSLGFSAAEANPIMSALGIRGLQGTLNGQ